MSRLRNRRPELRPSGIEVCRFEPSPENPIVLEPSDSRKASERQRRNEDGRGPSKPCKRACSRLGRASIKRKLSARKLFSLVNISSHRAYSRLLDLSRIDRRLKKLLGKRNLLPSWGTGNWDPTTRIFERDVYIYLQAELRRRISGSDFIPPSTRRTLARLFRGDTDSGGSRINVVKFYDRLVGGNRSRCKKKTDRSQHVTR